MKFPLKYKAALLILSIVLATSVVATVVSSRMIKDNGQETYTRQAVHLADTIAVSVDGDQVRELRDAVMEVYDTTEDKVFSDHWGEPEFDAYLERFSAVSEMDAYTQVRDRLASIQDVNDVQSVYITWLNVEEKTIIYLVDAAEEDFCPPGVTDPFFYEDEEILRNPERGFLPTVTDTEEYGWLVATGKPIHDSTGELVGFACVDVSMDAVVTEEYRFIRTIALALLALAVVAGALGIWLVDWFLVRPINMLSNAAERYTNGEEGEQMQQFASLSIHARDEVEALAHSMAVMEKDINEHIANLLSTTQALVSTQAKAERMDQLASIDALTKVRNKRSYDRETKRLNQEIQAGKACFGLMMIDLNDLKKMNDTYGHDKGDIAINALCKLVCSVFKRSPVFRIGGDEFVVILEGQDYDNADTLITRFNAEVEKLRGDETLPPWKRITAAVGCAYFDHGKDTDTDTVFKRADKVMYERKKQMKAQQQFS
jgi:diguanylate cyclase (GGDEF)-like protein